MVWYGYSQILLNIAIIYSLLPGARVSSSWWSHSSADHSSRGGKNIAAVGKPSSSGGRTGKTAIFQIIIQIWMIIGGWACHFGWLLVLNHGDFTPVTGWWSAVGLKGNPVKRTPDWWFFTQPQQNANTHECLCIRNDSVRCFRRVIRLESYFCKSILLHNLERHDVHFADLHLRIGISTRKISTSEDCSFMKDFWQGLTDGLCLRAMNGLRMIANSCPVPIDWLVWAVLGVPRGELFSRKRFRCAAGVETVACIQTVVSFPYTWLDQPPVFLRDFHFLTH